MKYSRMLLRWPASFLFGSLYTCNIKVTLRCNLRCGFCGLWRRGGSREMYLQNYITAADKLKKMGAARIVLTGGEPLLRTDIVEITAAFARRGFSTTLLTNGTLADRERLLALKRAGLNDIGISLDSCDPETQDDICGRKGVWEKAVSTIRESVDIFHPGIVEVLTTVTSRNLTAIPDIVEFVVRDLKAWAVINPVNIPSPGHSILSAGSPDLTFPLPPRQVDRVFDTLRTMKRSGYRILVSNRFLEESRSYLKSGRYRWKCHAGERYLTVFPNGSISPCSDTPAIANILELSPGDFRKKAFRDQARKIRDACDGCIFSCWREASYLFTKPSVILERIRQFLPGTGGKRLYHEER
ncbi:radical SAM protein [bacterium]|nr:radical SAM protein [candidate division CSSED10-310 bacterium]